VAAPVGCAIRIKLILPALQIESAKLVGLNPKKYLKMAVNAHLDGVEIPLPHEIKPQA
jgi:hypothetical protein